MKTLAALTILALALLLPTSADAALVVTSGDFEDTPLNINGGNGQQNIVNWFDNTANFSSFYFGSSVAVAATLNNTGYIYQSLGTYNASDGPTLLWSVDAVNSNEGNGAGDPFEITFYSSNSFVGADGTDIAATLTPFASDSFSDSGSAVEDIVTRTGSVSLAGLPNGSKIWIRFQGGGFDGIDNVTVTQVPAPAALPAAVGLIGVLAARRRRVTR